MTDNTYDDFLDAIRQERLDLMVSIHIKTGFIGDVKIFDQAALTNNYNIIYYLYRNCCPFVNIYDIFERAIKLNHHNIVRFYLDEIGNFPISLIWKVIKSDKFEVFIMLLEANEKLLVDETLCEAIRHKNTKCVEYLLWRDCEYGLNSLGAACYNNDLKMVRFLVENCKNENLLNDEDAGDVLYNTTNVEIIKYLHEEKGITLTGSIFSYCIGDLKCCEYLYRKDCSWDEDVFEAAMEYGDVEVVAFLHRNGCPFDPSFCEGYNEEVKRYIHDNVLFKGGLCETNCIRCSHNKFEATMNLWYLEDYSYQNYIQWLPQEIIEDVFQLFPDSKGTCLMFQRRRTSCVCYKYPSSC